MLLKQKLVKDRLGGVSILIVVGPDGQSVRAFRAQTGVSLGENQISTGWMTMQHRLWMTRRAAAGTSRAVRWRVSKKGRASNVWTSLRTIGSNCATTIPPRPCSAYPQSGKSDNPVCFGRSTGLTSGGSDTRRRRIQRDRRCRYRQTVGGTAAQWPQLHLVGHAATRRRCHDPGSREGGRLASRRQAYAVNGQRPKSNAYLLDGVSNLNRVDGGYALKIRSMRFRNFVSSRKPRPLSTEAPAELPRPW